MTTSTLIMAAFYMVVTTNTIASGANKTIGPTQFYKVVDTRCFSFKGLLPFK